MTATLTAGPRPRLDLDLLRVSTAGSVDDGKSTLIGRLLYDTKQVLADQLAQITDASRRRGYDRTELALLTDGLRAEREQGITIDVAYRYFTTARRKFIIADTPGHPQYTRNMVTGASTADLAVILVDARNGLTEQSRRHAFIASLLGIPHFVVAVNKMDLVGWSQDRYDELRDAFTRFAAKLETTDITFVPISALHGDNVVNPSRHSPWYDGTTLLAHLEHVHIASDRNLIDARFPVQWVIRPQTDAAHDYRAYAGQVAGGTFKPGDEILALPTGLPTTIAAIDTYDGPVAEAIPPMSVAIRLTDDLDVARGHLLCRPDNRPTVGQDLDAMLCWMTDQPLTPGSMWTLKHTTNTVRCRVTDLRYRLDINTLHRDPTADALHLNDIARIRLRTTTPLTYDPYRRNRTTGSYILIEDSTNRTVGTGTLNPAP
jgi:bifunctional enzyme CysN/CysC